MYKEDLYKKQIGNRIAKCRIAAGMTQSELADKLTEKLGRVTNFHVSAISAIETGRRGPQLSTLLAAADILKVSLDYLCGFSDTPTPSANIKKITTGPVAEEGTTISVSELPISVSDLKRYDHLPVYICFNNYEYMDCWGVVDMSRERFVCSVGALPFDTWLNKVDIFTMAPYSSIYSEMANMRKINISDFMNINKCYVSIHSRSETVKQVFDGWYTVDNKMNVLYNSSGIFLSLDKLGITYDAYINKL